MNILVALVPFLLLYVFSYILILLKINSEISSESEDDIDVNSTLKYSIIVAAKNESKNIPILISALIKINYPNVNYEVIIVDDNSVDNTFNIAEELCSGIGNYSVVKAINKNYIGKRGALDYGISIAKYPNILITDADCIPGENWLKECSKNIINNCDFYFGIAPFIQRKNLVNKISCYENFVNSFLAMSALKLNLPYTASARNFGFKKEAYDKVGGYSNTTDTISGDDDLLIREAVKNKLCICSLTSPGSFVYSETKNSFKEYFSQRARHTQTSFYYPLKQKLFLTVWHLLNMAFIFSPFFMFVNILFVIPFLIKIILDVTRANLYQKKFGYRIKIYEVFYLQVLYEIFLVVHFLNARFSKIEWK
jgi:cellulose synthase/poly-beta-1,6-N-acetylglucosamine synthase-like glycosyltransferase